MVFLVEKQAEAPDLRRISRKWVAETNCFLNTRIPESGDDRPTGVTDPVNASAEQPRD